MRRQIIQHRLPENTRLARPGEFVQNFQLNTARTNLYTISDVVSPTSETTNVGSPWAVFRGVKSLESGASNITDGSYSMKIVYDASPTFAQRLYCNLATLGLSAGVSYDIEIDMKHDGSGSPTSNIDVNICEDNNTLNAQLIGSCDFTETTFKKVSGSFTASAVGNYIVFRTNPDASSGGGYIDNIRIYAA